MAMDKTTANQLKRYAAAFREARERGANESETSMFIVKFFEEVLGWDSLKGEISKETCISDRYCDIALKIDGSIRLLIECKAASLKELVDRHIEQAENYASRAGLVWVLLSNGVEWKMFHLTFVEGEGIAHDLAFEAKFIDECETDIEGLWAKLSLLERSAMNADALADFWSQKKVMSPASMIRALFTQDVLTALRRELNRNAPARLDLEDVFTAVRDVLSKEALLEAGEISITKRRKRRRKAVKTDQTASVVSAQVATAPPSAAGTAAAAVAAP